MEKALLIAENASKNAGVSLISAKRGRSAVGVESGFAASTHLLARISMGNHICHKIMATRMDRPTL